MTDFGNIFRCVKERGARMKAGAAALLLLLCARASCAAAALSIPPLPAAEWDDAEVVTNVALPAAGADARIFSFRLELDASPSNCVSLVFGRDANADGVLARSEEAALVGWDCGAWKIVDCVTGAETAEPGAAGRTALDGRLFAVPRAAPHALELSAGGVPVFAARAAEPPRLLFDAGWDTLKVVCRGLDAPIAQIDCSADNTPLVIRIR